MTRKFALKLVVSSILMAIILVQIDLERVVSELSATKLEFLFVAFLLVLFKFWISALRWKLLLFPKKINIGVIELTRLYLIGAFFNNFLPTNVGGDAVKIARLRKQTGEGIDSAASVFMERFTGVIALLLISSGALLYFYRGWGILIVLGTALIVFLCFLLLQRLQGIHHLIEGFYESIMAYKSERSALLYAFLIGFAAQIVVVLAYYAAFLALDLRPPVLWTLFVLPIIILAGFLPISLNGLGIEESLFIFFFGSYLAVTTAPQALAVCFAFRLVKIAASLVGGLVYSLER